MPRMHYRRRPLRPRRPVDCVSETCVKMRPPSDDDDVFIGFCHDLGVWRICAPPFDACGVMDEDGGTDAFFAALAAAAKALRPVRPELAESFERLVAEGG